MSGPVKLCKDCIYIADKSPTPHFDTICMHPSNVSLVTGESSHITCNVMRSAAGACGPDGKLFVSKPPIPEREGLR